MKRLTVAILSLVVTAASFAPAFAYSVAVSGQSDIQRPAITLVDDHRHHGDHGDVEYRRRHDDWHNDHHHHHNRAGAIIGGIAAGAIIGGALAPQRRDDYDDDY